MSVFKNGTFYHYEFVLDGRRRRGSTGTTNKQLAINEERRQRERLEKSYGQILEEESREQQRKTIQEAADEFLEDYRAKHQSATFAEYALGHVSSLPAIRGCSVKVLQNERRLNIGCQFRRINGTTIRYRLGDINAFMESQPAGGGALIPANRLKGGPGRPRRISP